MRSTGKPSTIPEPLREAAHHLGEAPGLLYLLLLDSDPAIRDRQLALVARHHNPEVRATVERLGGSAAGLRAEHRLPLVQLALGVLRDLDAAGLERLLGTLDELVHADARVCTFEYALQKMIAHHLRLAQRPSGGPGGELHSFHAVAGEIALALSVLAHRSASSAEQAFAAGAAQLRGLDLPLGLVPTAGCGLAQLDQALERLSRASGPIKKRFLLAASAVATADGTLAMEEAELLRALASVLDCPLPPLPR